MTVSTKVYIEHPDLALAHTVQSIEGIEIGVIPDAGTDPEHDDHFFWIEADDFDAVEAALQEDHTVSEFAKVSETDSRRTYRIRYSDEAKLVSPVITELEGLMLESKSESRGWVVELRLPDHGALELLDERVSNAGIRLEVLAVSQTEPDYSHSEFALTEPQIEALVSAYEHGYYDDPREISLEELGSVLGLSRTAVSGRLRRASHKLIEEAFGYEDSERN